MMPICKRWIDSVNRLGEPAGASGFTLIEIMVALVILTTLAAAITHASSRASDNALALEQRLLARWISENELTQIRLHGAPAIGQHKSWVESAHRRWQVVIEVKAVEMDELGPQLRRIEVQVNDAQPPHRSYDQLIGILEAPA